MKFQEEKMVPIMWTRKITMITVRRVSKRFRRKWKLRTGLIPRKTIVIMRIKTGISVF